MSDTEQYLIQTADKCARLARRERELADDLEAVSQELLAKAVQLDTARERDGMVRKKSSRS
jgi:hypothetical protein